MEGLTNHQKYVGSLQKMYMQTTGEGVSRRHTLGTLNKGKGHNREQER